MADEKFKTLLTMPNDMRDEVQAYADRRGISRNSAVCLLVRERLDEIALEQRERELAIIK